MGRDKKTCPYCSGTWNGIIGPGGSYTVEALKKAAGCIRSTVGRTYVPYVCSECGYTEFYKE